MKAYTVVSSDSHVIEPPDLWTGRIDVEFQERAPRVVEEEDGEWWFVDGHRTDSFEQGTQAGLRFQDSGKLSIAGRFANVRPGAYIPDEFVKDLDLDGVYGATLYPTEGLLLYTVPDSMLLSAIFRAYNDWLAEFCQRDPARLKGIGMLNVDEVADAVGELRRAAKQGLAGGLITVYPPENRTYNRSEYESLWAEAEGLGIPLSLHVATNRAGTGQGEFHVKKIRPTEFATIDHWVRVSLADLIFSGVFERHPGLKVGSIEHELGWAPFFVQLLDYTYTQRAHREGWIRFKGDWLPSDFFRRNIFLSFQEDAFGLRERALIGLDGLMWGNDYPHIETTFPRSRQVLDQVLKGLPAEEKKKIAGGNAAKTFGFSN